MTCAADRHQLAAEIKQLARRLGFELVGIASAEPSKYRQYFREWLDDGRAGTMEYLGRRFEERVDPNQYVPGAISVVCVAMNYHVPLEPPPVGEQARIARYALGDDYHEVIKERLWKLADWLRQSCPEAITRACVDTAPVLERDIAARCGVGWIGKNTCAIHPQMGSWLLLGEVITTVPLPVDEPQADRCGTCRRCIDACPTGAIDEPYQLDPRKCISYLTIEHREAIPREFHQAIGDWIYGCDICQEVCPWNSKAPFSKNPALQTRFASGTINTSEVLNWTQSDYSARLSHSAMKRVKLNVLQRNARIVQANQKEKAC